MMVIKNPRIFVCAELLKGISRNIDAIDFYIPLINEVYYKPIFMYVYALFESALSQSLKHFLTSFPEKISNDKYKIDKDSLVYPITNNMALEEVVEISVRASSMKKVPEFIKDYMHFFDISVDVNYEVIGKISDMRNAVTHDDAIKISNAKNTKEALENELKDACKHAQYLNEILLKIYNAIQLKYATYTKEKMLKDLWKYSFNSPLLTFDDIWNLTPDYLHIKDANEIASRIRSASSGEKFFLAFWFQQYSPQLNDEFFHFYDIPMLVSISDTEKLHFLIKVFEKYPYLLNGDFIRGSRVYQ